MKWGQCVDSRANITKITNEIRKLKKTILNQFNINEQSKGMGTATEACNTITSLLRAINDYIQSNTSSSYCIQLINDVNHLIRLYQIIGGNVSVLDLNLLFNTMESFSSLNEPIYKPARQLQEKIAVYCDPEQTIKQQEAPKQIQIKIMKEAQGDDAVSYIRMDNKQGGIHFVGKDGGIYEYKAKQNQSFGHKMLVKQETKRGKIQYSKIIAEFVGGAIIKIIAQDEAAQIELLSIDNHYNNPSEGIYIGSQFFNDYTDLYKFAYWLHDKKDLEDRPKFVGSINYGPIQKTVSRCVTKTAFAKITSAMLVASMFDMHSANIGFNGGSLVCLDFASSLYHLHKKIHPHSHLRRLPGFGPTNHLREYPRTMRITNEMASALEKAAKINYQPAIETALNKVKECYRDDLEPIKQFVTHLGMKPKSLSGIQTAEQYYEDVKKYLIQRMEARKSSLNDLALEIRIDLAIQKNGSNSYIINVQELNKLIEARPDYFKAHLKDGYYHFHLLEHKSCYLARLFGLRITENRFAKMINDAITPDIRKKYNLPSQLVISYPLVGRVGLLSKLSILKKTAQNNLKDIEIPNISEVVSRNIIH